MKLDRRTVLRGAGVSIALPWLESLAAAPGPTINRAAFLFIPNGVHMPEWTPSGTGSSTVLPGMLSPLEPLKDRLTVLSGLSHANAAALGDGPGDHARSSACFLTGAHPYKTKGSDISVGVSVDQVAARHLEHRSRFGSIELGCDPALTSGNCDSGYSCAYSANISWRSHDTPVLKEIRPRLVFERLFALGPVAETADARQARLVARRSILDFVGRDARRLRSSMGVRDRQRVDDYLEGVREIERRIEQVERNAQDPSVLPDIDLPNGLPGDYREHLRLMHEMMILAFRLDLTRVCTFMWANEGSNRTFPHLDVREGHHHLSHHKGDESMIEGVRRINRFQLEEFAWFLQRLDETPDADGRSLLDNSMVMFGGAIADGNRHNHDDLPIVLAGGGAGTLDPIGHRTVAHGTPVCNLYLSMLDRLGVPVDTFGDATARLF